MRHALMRFVDATSGNLATLTALSAPVALVLAALAIDSGALYVERRSLQSLADLAAITAADNIGVAETAAKTFLQGNGFIADSVEDALNGDDEIGISDGSGCGVGIIRGRYRADPSLAPSKRFEPHRKPYNAVRVALCHPGTRYFSVGFFGAPTIGAAATAATRDEASFSIGSRLARLDGGIANALLGGLTGSTITLTAMDYEALLSADVRLLSFLDSLHSRLKLDAADYNELMAAEATLGDLAAALGAVDGLVGAASRAADRLAAQFAARGGKVELSRLLDIGSLGLLPVGTTTPAGNDPHLGVFQILSAAASLSLANGRRQLELDLGADAGDLASLRLVLAIGEAPQSAAWFSVGEEEQIVTTAQTRLLLEAGIGGSGILSGTTIRLPLLVEIAHARARLERLACPATPADPPRLVVAARPGIARIRIAEADHLTLARFSRRPDTTPALLMSTPIVRVTGRADIEIANRFPTRLRFSAADIKNRAVKRVSTTDIAGSLIASLVEELDIEVQAAGLGISMPTNVAGAVSDALKAAAPALDSVLTQTLATLGLSIGEADVRVHGAQCGRAVLVQ